MSITHAFVNPKTDSADTTITRPSDWNADHVGNGLEVYNVMDHGVMGGGADDTTAMQAAFAALATGAYQLYIPEPVNISDTLDIPNVQYRHIFGAGMGRSVITMTANNKPIIRFRQPDNHTLNIHDLTLKYGTDQATAQTDAMAIQFDSTLGNTGTYWSVFRNLQIIGAKIGMGVKGAGVSNVWATLFENIQFSKISTTAIRFVSSVGQGIMMFKDIGIYNTGSSIVSNGPAIELAPTEANIDGLGIEGWYNQAVNLSGGVIGSIRNFHIESHTFTQSAYLFEIADGPCHFLGGSIDGVTTSGLGFGVLFRSANAAANLTVENIGSVFPVTGSGSIAALDGSGKIWAKGNDWHETAVMLEWVPGAFGNGTGRYARVTVDELPPIVDALPTPSATYRGRRFRVLGGAGVADVVSECSKNASDVYVWVTK